MTVALEGLPLEVVLPERVAIKLETLVKAGWFAEEAEIISVALRDASAKVLVQVMWSPNSMGDMPPGAKTMIMRK
jgi:hypothetical protein